MRRFRASRKRRIVATALAAAAIALFAAHARERRFTDALRAAIDADATAPSKEFPPLPDDLPPPVRRYFRYAFPAGPRPMRSVTFRNRGELRTDPTGPRWLAFSATQHATIAPRAFLWDARVMHGALGVVDSYVRGDGSGRVTVAGLATLEDAHDDDALDEGALHRYLAEAVWYPAALWPGHGLTWSPIDARRALATLVDHGHRVALEFRFAPDGRVASIYTPARWGRFGGRYRRVAWEGRFSGAIDVHGVRMPAAGEVGWYVRGRWQPVWRGRIDAVSFDAHVAGR